MMATCSGRLDDFNACAYMNALYCNCEAKPHRYLTFPSWHCNMRSQAKGKCFASFDMCPCSGSVNNSTVLGN